MTSRSLSWAPKKIIRRCHVFMGIRDGLSNFEGFSVKYLLPIPIPIPESHSFDQGFCILSITHSDRFSLWPTSHRRTARTIGRRSRGPFLRVHLGRNREVVIAPFSCAAPQKRTSRPQECAHIKFLSQTVSAGVRRCAGVRQCAGVRRCAGQAASGGAS